MEPRAAQLASARATAHAAPVIPWTELGRASVPGEERPLVLARRDDEFVIRVGHAPLMSSRMHASEEALATCACEKPALSDHACVLVAGLGMGFTLAAALRALPATAEVVVAELVPALVDWNRGPLADLAGRPLEDQRVSVRVGDVAELLRGSYALFDAILLDVDNGPNGLTRASNERLYSHEGLRETARALRTRGVLAVWSAASDHEFTRRLHDAGFGVEERQVRARGTKGGRHTLWLATRGG